MFVPLNEISDDHEVLPALGRALGLTTATLDAVSIALSSRQALVVLDNCEHVIDAAADLVEELLAASGTVTVLATSREGLALDGEQLIAVPGLGGSDGDAAAVALFVDRARNVDATFEVGADDLEVVAEICRRLDGLPLAIELAAARVNVLPPTELLVRLDERFEVLTGGRRRRSRDRQKTLRETVDWSYELLSNEEKRAFEQLSVFAGSFGLDGAAAILDAMSGPGVVDLIEALVSKSLLVTVDVEGFHRYRYLETIRSYAEERLDEQGAPFDVVDRLHAHLVAVVETTVDGLLSGPASGANRLRVEIPNLRRAFDHALALGDVERAAALITPFAPLRAAIDWRIHGWADEVLALEGAAGSPSEAELLALRSTDIWLENRFGEIRSAAEEMMRVADNGPGISFGVQVSALSASHLLGDDERTLELVDRFDAAAAADNWSWGFFRQMPALLPSDPDRPSVERDDLQDDLAILTTSPSDIARSLGDLVGAIWAYTRGDFDEMLERVDRSVESGVVGAGYWFAALQVRAWAQYQLGEFAEAVRTADEDIEQAYRLGDRSAMIVPLAVYSMVLKAWGEVDSVAIVRGRLPRRLTLLMVRELAEIDRWLAAELSPERRRELATMGSDRDPRELQALVHEVAGRHLDT